MVIMARAGEQSGQTTDNKVRSAGAPETFAVSWVFRRRTRSVVMAIGGPALLPRMDESGALDRA